MQNHSGLNAAIVRCTLRTFLVLSTAAFACQSNASDSSNQTTKTETVNTATPIQVINPSNKPSQIPVAPATNLSKCVAKDPKPVIRITTIPRLGPGGPDEMDPIAGSVKGVNGDQTKVVIFTHTNVWYVQPYTENPYTAIKDDCTWETSAHLGYEYAALLVKSSYKPSDTIAALPSEGGEILAIVRVVPKK